MTVPFLFNHYFLSQRKGFVHDTHLKRKLHEIL